MDPVAVLSVAAALADLESLLEQRLRAHFDAADAHQRASDAKAEIAHLAVQHFGQDAHFVGNQVLGKAHVQEAILSGESSDRILLHFVDAFSEEPGVTTGGPVLKERVDAFIGDVADVLLRLGIRPNQALGVKMDTNAREQREQIEQVRAGIDGFGDQLGEIKDQLDPHGSVRAQLSLAQRMFDKGQLESVQGALEIVLERRSLEDLPREIQAQVQTMSSGVVLYRGDPEAARQGFERLLDAVGPQRSLLINAATANLLTGNNARARELAQRVLSEHSRDGTAMGVELQAAYEQEGMPAVDELVDRNTWIIVNPTAAAALALIYEKEDQPARADELLRPHEPDVPSTYEQALLVSQRGSALARQASEILRDTIPIPGMYPPRAAELLEAAEEKFTKVIEQLNATDHDDLLAGALANRSTVRLLQNNEHEALQDLDRAIDLGGDSAQLRLNRARLHLTRGRFDDAISELVTVPEDERTNGESALLGEALLQAGRPGDAIAHLSADMEVNASDPYRRVAVLVALLRAHHLKEDFERVQETRTLLEGEAGDQPDVITILAGLEASDGNDDAAEQLYRRALESPSDKGKQYASLLYGEYLMAKQRWSEAGQVFAELATGSESEYLVHRLAICLFYSKEPEEALVAVRQIAEPSRSGPDLYFIEAAALEQIGKTDEGIEVCRSLAKRYFDNAGVQVHAASQLVRLDDTKAAQELLTGIPPTAVGLLPEDLMIIADLRRALGMPNYLRFAWHAYRADPSSPEIRGQYLALFFAAEQDGQVPIPTSVGPNTTVQLSLLTDDGEVTATPKRSVVEVPSRQGLEIALDSGQAKQLLGKSVGDTFPWNTGGRRRLTARVDSIEHVYVTSCFEAQELVKEEGGGPFVEVISGTPEGNLKEVLQIVEHASQNRAKAIGAYAAQPMFPLHALAKGLGIGIHETMMAIQQSQEAVIRAFDNDADLWTERDKVVDLRTGSIIMDASSLITLAELGMLDTLDAFGWQPVVPQSVAQELDREILGRTGVLEGDKLPDDLAPVGNARRWVRSQNVLHTKPPRQVVQAELRKVMSDALGWHGCDPVWLASEMRVPLLTDDLGLAVVALKHYGVIPIHTLYILKALLVGEAINAGDYVAVIERLQRLSYASLAPLASHKVDEEH